MKLLISKTGFPASNLVKDWLLSNYLIQQTGSPQDVTWSSGPLKRIQCRVPVSALDSNKASAPWLDSLSEESAPDVASHWCAETEARGVVPNSLQRHLFQYGAPLTYQESFPHRHWQFQYCKRLQDNITAYLGWHCSRSGSWNHINKNAVRVFCKQRPLLNKYFINIWKGPKSTIGKGVYQEIFDILVPIYEF